MPDWSIRIVPNPQAIAGQPALLVVDLVGAKPGAPLQTQEDDLVSWNNETNSAWQPWPTDANYNALPANQVSMEDGNYLSDPIPGNLSSTPAYDVVMPTSGSIIYYCLKDANGNPTQVRGQILVTAIPAALNVPTVRG